MLDAEINRYYYMNEEDISKTVEDNVLTEDYINEIEKINTERSREWNSKKESLEYR